MKIVIPSVGGKLCSHFGHCEDFTFVEVNAGTAEIVELVTKVPEEGISCQSAYWIVEQGVDVVLAGGMGGRPLEVFAQNGISVITGCPEIDIKVLVNNYLKNTLIAGENSCGGEHHHCHGHGGGCSGHNH